MTANTRKNFFGCVLATLLALIGSCGGGGAAGGGGGQTPVDPPSGVNDPPYVATLLSGAADDAGRARLHWALPGAGFEAALFQSTSAVSVYGGAPVATGLSGTSTTRTGLPNGVIQFFGIGVGPIGSGTYTPSGAVLRVLPAAPIYVDAAANPVVADGMSPATAFPSLDLALELAANSGGGNVWVKDGTYTGTQLLLTGNVHLCGGFGGAFTLASREPLAGNTVVQAPTGQVLFSISATPQSTVIDGMCLDGRDISTVGVDVDDSEAELRSLKVRAFTGRGIRLRSTLGLFADELDVMITGCAVTRNGADGISLSGAFDLRIYGSNFDANLQEGVDMDDLVALDGGKATLVIEGCRFFGNGTDGLDADLAQPPLTPATTGLFAIEIRASRFERNGRAGVLIDHDFEAIPGYSADTLVRECIALANGTTGIQIDADGPGAVVVHGCLISANVGDGLVVGSDTNSDVAIVSATALTGNLGAGIRTLLGVKTVATSQCIIAGNGAGGVVSTGRDSATTSSIYYLQDAAGQNVRSWFDVTVTDPLAGTFTNSPEEYLRVTARMGTDLTVAGMPALMPGVPIELNDDTESLTASRVAPPVITASSLPAGFTVPGSLTAFGNGASVIEDYQLPSGSPALGEGLTTQGGPAQDAGVFGSPVAQAPGVPEEERRELLFPVGLTPPPVTVVGANDSIAIDFSKTLSAGSVTSTTVRATTSPGGADLVIGLSTNGARITVDAPGGGWGNQDFVIELHRGLAAQDGTALTTPIALPFRR